MFRTTHSLWATAVTLALCVPGASAQGTGQAVNEPNTPQSPLPLLLSKNTSAPDTGGQEFGEASAYAPVLSGVQAFTPGSAPTTRSFLFASVHLYPRVHPNPLLHPRPE